MPSLNSFNADALPLEHDLSEAFPALDAFAAGNGVSENIGNQATEIRTGDVQSKGMPPLVSSHVCQKASVEVTQPQHGMTKDTSVQLRVATDLTDNDGIELASEQGDVSTNVNEWIGRRLVRATSRNVLAKQLSRVESRLVTEDSSSKLTEVYFMLLEVLAS